MNRLIRAVLVLSLAVLLSSCAAWTHLEQPTRVTGPNGLSVMAPADWVRFNLVGDDVILLTRDGLPIQMLRIEYRKADKAFPSIKKKSNPDMLPSETADLLLADLRADKALANLKVLENTPYKVAGKLGFRIHGQYRDERGASFDLVAVGCTTKTGLVLLFYRSLSIHYYARDLKLFDQTVDSVVLGQS